MEEHVDTSEGMGTSIIDPQQTIMEEDGEEIIIKNNGQERKAWGGRIEFILTCIGTAVGLGNIWRFPYLCFENGGGAFLIPYGITLCLIGLPIFFMELSLGQFASAGPICMWSISPLFTGLGYGMVTISAVISIYYNIVIAQCLYYFGVSFTRTLPWSTCNNTWNNKTICYDGSDNSTSVQSGVSPSEEYYDNYVLNISSSINDIGMPQWRLVICLAVCWLFVMVVLIKGIRYLGKVAYFTAIFPYLILTILLIRGSLLPGSLNGIKFYIFPKFEYLLKPKVWVAAATQIFFSLSVCSGNLITMSSYNHFKNNCLRDAVLVALINCGTSIYGGFVIFSNMGFMAYVKNVTVGEVIKGGPGLAFKVYPDALTHMPLSPLWSVLFFLMMLTLGMGSELALVETVLSGIQDRLSRLGWFKEKNRVIPFRMIVCLVGFILGIPMTCRGGMYILGLLDDAISGFTMLVIAVTEMLVISYCYGIKRFMSDIELMIHYPPSRYWKFCWMGISPALAIILIIAQAIMSGSITQEYNAGFVFLKYGISLLPIALLTVIFFYVYCKHGGWLLLTELRKPIEKWGPVQKEHNDDFIKSVNSLQGRISEINFFRSNESIANKFLKRLDDDQQSTNTPLDKNINALAETYLSSKIDLSENIMLL